MSRRDAARTALVGTSLAFGIVGLPFAAWYVVVVIGGLGESRTDLVQRSFSEAHGLD